MGEDQEVAKKLLHLLAKLFVIAVVIFLMSKHEKAQEGVTTQRRACSWLQFSG